VMVFAEGQLEVLRGVSKRAVAQLPSHVWMALAKAVPVK
jgi:hypothetical protein